MTHPTAETIAILGANGVFARHLIPVLCDAGIPVRAVVRRPDSAGVARAAGCEIRTADIFDTDALAYAIDGCETVVNLTSALPGPSGRGNHEANDILRDKGSLSLIEACRRSGSTRLLQQSMSMVNATGDDSWGGEDRYYQGNENTVSTRAFAAALTMEERIRTSGLEWVILRGGMFYGPGTGSDDNWFKLAETGRLKLPGDGSGFVSLCHISDMARATASALQQWTPGGTMIVCDDEPVTWRDLFHYVLESVGRVGLKEGGEETYPSFRLANTRAKQTLGWKPFFRSFREGLAR
ncbi:NAD-dependent epimerase/dehydratase family protein [Chachezhania antarctica]|uniref:NAD-dependent epimerase/dehydratase family protein n=1 Tax=Chachezhania antarctica TaxID=2340860 RepID=UPI000EAE8A2E|nr:NAD(P)-dependent oxidoreductase [Chachezhania antarctica]|tara:strand:- start:8669 stop:9553 length:885 start_codon:yes stop_codon:yes gene_type:complete